MYHNKKPNQLSNKAYSNQTLHQNTQIHHTCTNIKLVVVHTTTVTTSQKNNELKQTNTSNIAYNQHIRSITEHSVTPYKVDSSHDLSPLIAFCNTLNLVHDTSDHTPLHLYTYAYTTDASGYGNYIKLDIHSHQSLNRRREIELINN